LQERSWLKGAIEPDGIVQMVRNGLGNNPSRFKRFVKYEAPLTTPEKIRSVGAHYRALLKDFSIVEANTRLEEQRTANATRPDSWQCPDGKCKNGIVEDENGVPVKLCTCALVQAFPPEKREKLQAQITALRVMNGLAIEGAAQPCV
jgi:hypothetical protein